jgi:hypothetical protein
VNANIISARLEEGHTIAKHNPPQENKQHYFFTKFPKMFEFQSFLTQDSK